MMVQTIVKIIREGCKDYADDVSGGGISRGDWIVEERAPGEFRAGQCVSTVCMV